MCVYNNNIQLSNNLNAQLVLVESHISIESDYHKVDDEIFDAMLVMW